MDKKMELISSEYIEKFSIQCSINWTEAFHKLQLKARFSKEDFEYYIIASSLYSSKIEGNTLDINSFMNNREKLNSATKEEFKEIEELVIAYKFASENKLSLANFLKAHEILSKTLLKAKERGKFRLNQVGVFDSTTGRPVYMAVEPEFVKQEISKLFADIELLLKQNLNYNEVFYYASKIHLWIAMIHPFADGNGRASRLLEKWFLASKLGEAVWSINSEKYYWDNRPDYYKNIALGYNYYSLYWERCIPFLLMLPEALTKSLQ